MVIELSPEEFARKQAALQVKYPQAVADGNEGTISSSDVTLGYFYDGTGSLRVTVLQKHSMRAKFAPEALLEKSVRDMFATL